MAVCPTKGIPKSEAYSGLKRPQNAGCGAFAGAPVYLLDINECVLQPVKSKTSRKEINNSKSVLLVWDCRRILDSDVQLQCRSLVTGWM